MVVRLVVEKFGVCAEEKVSRAQAPKKAQDFQVTVAHRH